MVALLVSIRNSLHFNVSDALRTDYIKLLTKTTPGHRRAPGTKSKTRRPISSRVQLDGVMRRNVIRELGSLDVEVDLASLHIFPVMSLNNKKPDNKTKCENDNCHPPTRVI